MMGLAMIVLATMFLTMTRTAAACSACTMAMMDYYVPAATPWMLISIVWFIAFPLSYRLFLRASDAAPGTFAGTTGWLFAAMIWSGMSAGHVPFFLLGIATAVRTALRCTNRFLPRRKRRINGGMLAAFLLLYAYSGIYYAYKPRHYKNDAEFIAKHPGTPVARSLLRRMKPGPDAEPFRQMILDGIPIRYGALDALKRLGHWTIDGPILIDLLQAQHDGRAYSDPGDLALTASALGTLLGEEPKNLESPDQWWEILAPRIDRLEGERRGAPNKESKQTKTRRPHAR